MQLHLDQSVALVVGGVSGIGRACVQSFLDEGAQVVLWDIATADDILLAQSNCTCLSVDITDLVRVQEALQQTLTQHPRIDHVVHAAAIGSGQFGSPFTELSPQDWHAVLQVNVQGLTHVAHTLAPVLMQQGHGTIVCVASVAGQIGSPTDPPYSAAKAANINFAQVMARDLAPHGIRVNTVCPGMVPTPLNRSVWAAWLERQPESERLSYEDWGQQKIEQLIPLGTWQTPEDVADMIVFLSSRRAAQVTGQTINVDGGYVMHW